MVGLAGSAFIIMLGLNLAGDLVNLPLVGFGIGMGGSNEQQSCDCDKYVFHFCYAFNSSAVSAPCLLIKHLDFRLVKYTVKHPPATEPKKINALG